MKIEIEVNPGELTKSLKEILDTLPPDQRLELARKAMETWLKEPYDIERKAKEQAEVERIKHKDSWGRKETETEIRCGYDFRNSMQGWKSTKEQMVENITREISEQYKASVKEVIANDPKIQAMKDEVIQIVKENFPKIFHQAMVVWTASNVQSMLDTTLGFKALEDGTQKMAQNVSQRLMNLEGQVSSRM